MRKVINIAHRGYHKDFPENTLEAFEAAVNLGTDGIEFDVHETSDGGFFVFHDDFIDGRNITAMESAEVRKVRLDGEFTIPALDEVLQVCGKEMILLVELKQVRSLKEFLRLIRSMTDTRMMVLLSFDRRLITRLNAMAPEILKAVIGGDGKPAGNAVAGMAGMKCSELNADRINAVHAAGGLVFAWDCPDADSVNRALNFEIDGIISDCPDAVIRRAAHEN